MRIKTPYSEEEIISQEQLEAWFSAEKKRIREMNHQGSILCSAGYFPKSSLTDVYVTEIGLSPSLKVIDYSEEPKEELADKTEDRQTETQSDADFRRDLAKIGMRGW